MTNQAQKFRQYKAWKKRTNRLYRDTDTGGRPTPDRALERMRTKPYQGLLKSTPKEDTTNEESE